MDPILGVVLLNILDLRPRLFALCDFVEKLLIIAGPFLDREFPDFYVILGFVDEKLPADVIAVGGGLEYLSLESLIPGMYF